MDSILDVSKLLVMVGCLTAVTNVITEVLKKATWDKVPTNVLVVAIAEALTLTAGSYYAQVNGISILWFHVAAAIVVGILVAYAAMFGFDKLQEILNWNSKWEESDE